MYKFLCCSLLALPLATYAQSPASSSPSFTSYVGVGINAGKYYDKRHGEFVDNGLLYSPTVVAGIHLLPALAVQLSATTYEYKRSYTSQSLTYNGNPSNPEIHYISGTTHRRYYILPLLARYTFTESSKRLHLDALFGATVFHTREQSGTTFLDSQFQVTSQSSYRDNAIYGNLVLGMGLRYALTPHLEAASELRVNPFYFGYSGAMYPNAEISVRYCFGVRKSSTSAATTSSTGKASQPQRLP